jgi:hypothetical protein
MVKYVWHNKFKRQTYTSTTTQIYGFHHICLLNNGRDIFEEQLKTIQSSGLYDNTTTIFCSILGDGTINLPSKYVVIYQSADMSCYERKILEYMHQNSRTNIGMYWYIHTKGVSKYNHINYPNLRDWRILMEYWLIRKWKDRYNDLNNNDVVGINYTNAPHPHFSGNFWWARSDYIANNPTDFNYTEYLEPEMWVCKSKPRVLCAYDSKLYHHHFTTPYPSSYYIHNF